MEQDGGIPIRRNNGVREYLLLRLGVLSLLGNRRPILLLLEFATHYAGEQVGSSASLVWRWRRGPKFSINARGISEGAKPLHTGVGIVQR